jgi:glycosyltransferase 2 family protein
VRHLIAVLVSVALLALLYAFVDVGSLLAAMRSADPVWLATGLALVVPLTLATAWRFSLLVRDARVGLGEATRLVLAASTLNLFLPSKMGDLAKAHVLHARHGMAGPLSLSIVVFEKALDMAGLLFWGVIALFAIDNGSGLMLALTLLVFAMLVVLAAMLSPGRLFPMAISALARALPAKGGEKLGRFAESWTSVTDWFWSNPARALFIVGLSIGLWALHLVQFWFFTRALGGAVPLIDNMAFATLSILVGLLPFTLAGIGSRDAAIVYFYGAYLSPGAGAALGILATLRYVLPALAGLPFVGYFAEGALRLRRKAEGASVPGPGID